MIMSLLDLVIAFLPGAVKLLQRDHLMEVGEGDIVKKSISTMSRRLVEVINWLYTILVGDQQRVIIDIISVMPNIYGEEESESPPFLRLYTTDK